MREVDSIVCLPLSVLIEEDIMDNQCKSLIEYYKNLLADVNITMTRELENKIIELYPDESAIENYVMPIVIKCAEMNN